MSPTDLKERLINKIHESNDKVLLQELSVLFELQEPDILYELNDKQKEKISIAREQIKARQFLTDEEAEKDINTWLSE